MTPNSEDTVFGGISEEKVKAAAQAAAPKAGRQAPKSLTKAQKVVVGGMAAVALVGTSTALAMPMLTGRDGAEGTDAEPREGSAAEAGAAGSGLKVAQVDDDQSFAEAFHSAREAVGSGGVFQWHGNVYTTHTAEEWDGMSGDEQGEFTRIASDDIQQALDARQDEGALADAGHDGAAAEAGAAAHDDGAAAHDDAYVEAGSIGAHSIDDTADVRIIGTTDIEMEDGGVITVGEGIVDDHDVFLVDLDGDQVYDVAIDDADGNGLIGQAETYGVEDDNLTADLGYTGADELVL